MRDFIIDRIITVRSTPAIVWDNVCDLAHFLPLHWRYFKHADVLYADDSMQFLYYTSYLLPPFRFTRHYVSVRLLDPGAMSVSQVYKDVDRNDRTYLHIRVIDAADGTVQIFNRYFFRVSGPLSRFPRLVARLLDRRTTGMWREDREIVEVRRQLGGFSNPACAPDLNTLHDDLRRRFQDLMAKADDGSVPYFRFDGPL